MDHFSPPLLHRTLLACPHTHKPPTHTHTKNASESWVLAEPADLRMRLQCSGGLRAIRITNRCKCLATRDHRRAGPECDATPRDRRAVGKVRSSSRVNTGYVLAHIYVIIAPERASKTTFKCQACRRRGRAKRRQVPR